MSDAIMPHAGLPPVPPATSYATPTLPENAPFTPEQRAWLNGFLAGLWARAQPGAAPAAGAGGPASAALKPLAVLFGSQTGSAEALARRVAKVAAGRGFAATVLDMGQVNAARLAQESNVLVITSTYGDGEPPDNAKALHRELMAAEAPRLSALRFSVLGLGDTNYDKFCQCAKDFDARFEALGAARVSARAECDVDYEVRFMGWLESALAALGAAIAPMTNAAVGAPKIAGETSPASARSSDSGAGSAGALAGIDGGSGASGGVLAGKTRGAEGREAPPGDSGYSRQRPFAARVRETRNLSGEGSGKRVHHVVFDLEESGLRYEPGDALGVWPQNCPDAVGGVLRLLGCDGEEEVRLADGAAMPLRRALTERCDLGKPGAELAARLGAPTGAAGAAATDAVPHVPDLLRLRPEARLAADEFVRLLRPLAPRLYSISSSPRAHAGEVHLTVGLVRYEAIGRPRRGLCSGFLAERAAAGETRAGVFVHANAAFRAPESGDTPLIMVGPGTGIAPFRGFLADRAARGVKGRTWLFFGDQRAGCDFLYREELEAWRAEGVLERLDTAFSRDQAEKVYVQHRMLERAKELFAWLEAGAWVYVCGDAARMAKDVDAALHEAVSIGGGRTREQAEEYVQALRAARRYRRDVY